MYESEARPITLETRERLERCEVWFLRKILRIPWTNKVRNEVFRRAGVHKKLMRDARMRRNEIYGSCDAKMRSGALGINRKRLKERGAEKGAEYYGYRV